MTGPKEGLRQIIEVLPATMTAIAQIRFLLGSSSQLFAILRATVRAEHTLRPAQFPKLVVTGFLAHNIGDIEHDLTHSQPLLRHHFGDRSYT